MVEGYILQETLGFVIEYFHEFEHVTIRVWDAKEEGVFREILQGDPTKLVLNLIMS
jgi:hypothetical protein